MEPWEQLEKERYDWLYKNTPYGLCLEADRKNNSKSAAKMLLRHKIPTESRILDIGCGRADINLFYKNYVGCDISEEVIEINKNDPELCGDFYAASILELPELLKDEKFNTAACVDVLEHIPPDCVRETLKSISCINSDWFILSICCRDSGVRGPHGESLHPTVVRPDVWEEWVTEWFDIEYSQKQNVSHRYKTICSSKNRH